MQLIKTRIEFLRPAMAEKTATQWTKRHATIWQRYTKLKTVSLHDSRYEICRLGFRCCCIKRTRLCNVPVKQFVSCRWQCCEAWLSKYTTAYGIIGNMSREFTLDLYICKGCQAFQLD